jgi:hypothetical protein
MPQPTQLHFSGVRWKEGGADGEQRADHRSRDPAMKTSVERQNTELRDRNELLEEQIRKLRKTLAPRLLFPLDWHLNRGETTVLACLYTSPDGFRSNIMLKACAESFSANSDCYQVASVRIFNLRKKLRRFGIRIITRHSEGYILPPDAHKIVEAALKKENE